MIGRLSGLSSRRQATRRRITRGVSSWPTPREGPQGYSAACAVASTSRRARHPPARAVPRRADDGLDPRVGFECGHHPPTRHERSRCSSRRSTWTRPTNSGPNRRGRPRPSDRRRHSADLKPSRRRPTRGDAECTERRGRDRPSPLTDGDVHVSHDGRDCARRCAVGRTATSVVRTWTRRHHVDDVESPAVTR